VGCGSNNSSDEIGDAGAVLSDHHSHLAGGARVAIGHHAARAFMRAVPESDARLWKEVRNRHEGRPDDAEGMGNAVHLQHFHKGFFGGHFHGALLRGCSAQ
jgi:hypothetical protein